MNNTMLGLFNLGGGEIILILASLMVMAVVVGGIIVLVVFLTRKGGGGTPAGPVRTPPPAPPPSPACPRCGAPLPAGAPQGLCPRCVLGVGLATHTDAPGESGPHGTRVAQPPLAPADLARHFPQLEILDCLGRGGMGVVYKARQPKLNRLVALKILAPEKSADPRFAERFQREAQALARLSHPNIVTVHDFGEADGLYYLLMEYVDGVTLRQLLQTRKLAPEEALGIVPKICEALQFAHELGVVHRDIKPENVLLDKQGAVKIADFGIAKLMGGTPLTPSEGEPASGRAGEGTLTQDQVLGTPHYMAPEQVETPQLVDHRADIYSLGVVFYEMLTGELPLGKFSPPSHRVKMDVRLDEVVLHALEKEPDRRYQHASQVRTDVETIARTEGGSGKYEPERGPVAPPLAAGGAESAWDRVRGPGTGLAVTAILNWVAIPIIFLVTMGRVPQGPWSMFGRSALLLLVVSLAALVLSSVMLVAGLMMRRLTAYGFAVTGAILAMLVIPGNLIGLPIGIWALVVLSRREVRNAFGKGLPMPRLEPGHPSRSGGAWKVVAAVVAAVLLVLAIPVGALLLAIALPAYSKARDRARMIQARASVQAPALVVRGTVTDAVGGRPIAGAEVVDDIPNLFPDQIVQQARTDADGHYELRTCYVDQTLSVSAPGYMPRLYPFTTRPDFEAFERTNSPEVLVPADELTAYSSATTSLAELRRRERELLLAYKESYPLVQDVRARIEKLTRQMAELEQQYPTLAFRLDEPGHGVTDGATPQALSARVAVLGIILNNLQDEASHATSISEEAPGSVQKQIANVQQALLEAQRALLKRRDKLGGLGGGLSGQTNSTELNLPPEQPVQIDFQLQRHP